MPPTIFVFSSIVSHCQKAGYLWWSFWSHIIGYRIDGSFCPLMVLPLHIKLYFIKIYKCHPKTVTTLAPPASLLDVTVETLLWVMALLGRYSPQLPVWPSSLSPPPQALTFQSQAKVRQACSLLELWHPAADLSKPRAMLVASGESQVLSKVPKVILKCLSSWRLRFLEPVTSGVSYRAMLKK